MKTLIETETTTQVPGSPELTMPALTVVETERDVFAKNRETITAALRDQADKQIQNKIFNSDESGFCFVGCAVKALGKSV
jgi:HKD family nuclease